MVDRWPVLLFSLSGQKSQGFFQAAKVPWGVPITGAKTYQEPLCGVANRKKEERCGLLDDHTVLRHRGLKAINSCLGSRF